MSKLKIAQIVNLVSLFDSAKTMHNLTDGAIGINGAISPLALAVVGKEVFQYMPPKATYLSLGEIVEIKASQVVVSIDGTRTTYAFEVEKE